MAAEWNDVLSAEEVASVFRLSEETRVLCLQLQEGWSPSERRERAGLSCKVTGWMPLQFLVHHEEIGLWTGGRFKNVRVWRCVDGR